VGERRIFADVASWVRSDIRSRVARVARVASVVGVVVELASTATMDGGRRSARPETGRVWDGAKT
jgi:hypothetical protein